VTSHRKIIAGLDRDQLAGATGGLHIVSGLQDTKGQWVSKREYDVRGPQPPAPSTLPRHFRYGLQDTQGRWIKKDEVHLP
jgi:hypothetical protein